MMHFPCSQSRKEISLLELLCEGQEQQHRHPTDTQPALSEDWESCGYT